MNAPAKTTRSRAAEVSWVSLGLAVGCVGALIAFDVIDETFQFAQTRRGVLAGFLPRTALWLMWAGTALAVIAGLGSFVLIRRPDITSKAIIGIVVRSLFGIGVGLCVCVCGVVVVRWPSRGWFLVGSETRAVAFPTRT